MRGSIKEVLAHDSPLVEFLVQSPVSRSYQIVSSVALGRKLQRSLNIVGSVLEDSGDGSQYIITDIKQNDMGLQKIDGGVCFSEKDLLYKVTDISPQQRVEFKSIQWRNDNIMSHGQNEEFAQFQKMKKPGAALQ